ncbi:HpcH/HpaI aldolase/citrate lyase family protein [Algihabitans albus]|uniref:HpcH/HpaI aldolase/citrate lyase family protein n=1 Tax=Algihabitans albus TaxID=2164067 RepID=UPI001F2674EA|nr:CoA ester lyase [Algihabitans albus]
MSEAMTSPTATAHPTATRSIASGGERLPRRSYLYVPGSRPERFEKAMQSAADAVIIDLEDAVPFSEKDRARAAACAFLIPSHTAEAEREIFVRINGLGSRVGFCDLLALTTPEISAGGRLSGLLLPKVGSADELRLVEKLFDEADLPAEIAAIIETAEGVEQAAAIAAATPRLTTLMFGGADLAADLGVELAWAPLLYARARIVQAAALHGKTAVEMPWIELDDEAGYHEDLSRSFALGFAARAAIHPKQIAAIHAALAPSTEALARAERIVAAFEASNGGACLLDGSLVERPIIRRCQRLLALAERSSR